MQRRGPHWAVYSLVVLAAGCANPGTPRPPSLGLPEPVTLLSVDREGDVVRLSWSLSGKTTDGLDVRTAMTAQICREVAGTRPFECQTVLRTPVKAGPAEATDHLPPSLTGGPMVLIAYKIRILNGHGRSAAESAAAFTVSGPAPAPIEQFHAIGTEHGVLLQWLPETAPEAVEVTRIRPNPGPLPKKAGTGLGKPEDEPNEAQLQGTADADRAGGLLDHAARLGDTYRYTAQRVRHVTLGNRTVELRGEPSSEVTIALHDGFAPRPPTGLLTVSGPEGVDLSWRPSPEPDLAGYQVLRREEGQGAAPVVLPAGLLAEPAFHDASVVAGHTYRYSVVAVDRMGNRSIPSDSVTETVRLP